MCIAGPEEFIPSKNLALTLMPLLVRDKGALRLQDLAATTTCRQYFYPSIQPG